MKQILHEKSKFIINALNSAGFEAYPVGGCVRDFLLGLPCSDIDFTTNATVKDLLKIFADYKTIEVGAKYGTVALVIEGEIFEITTYRTDGTYSDNRHPENVIFTSSLAEDLKRRDFTINAMAFDKGEIIDLYGGKSDIENKLIRTVGDPFLRFSEDALRIMRALRFSATLGFDIEENTVAAIFEYSYLLREISIERIRDEFNKILCSEHFLDVFMEYYDVFCEFIPELAQMYNFNQNTKYHIYDVALHTAYVVKNSPYELVSRLAALLHDVGKPSSYTEDGAGVGHFKGHANVSADMAKQILTRLKYDNITIKKVLTLVNYHDTKIIPEKPYIKHMLKSLTAPVLIDLIKLKKADLASKNPAYSKRLTKLLEAEEVIAQIIKDNECYSLGQLCISGSDLKEIGITQGKVIGDILTDILNKVIDEELINDKNVILKHVENNFFK